jgi:hypothetical protein
VIGGADREAPVEPWIHSKMSADVREKLQAAVRIAADRLEEVEECGELCARRGADGQEMLTATLYRPVASTEASANPLVTSLLSPAHDWAAATNIEPINTTVSLALIGSSPRRGADRYSVRSPTGSLSRERRAAVRSVVPPAPYRQGRARRPVNTEVTVA